MAIFGKNAKVDKTVTKVDTALNKGFELYCLSENMKSDVKAFLYYVYQMNRDQIAVPYNLLIIQEEMEHSDDFVRGLCFALRDLMGEDYKIQEVKEEDYLAHNSYDVGSAQLLIVDGMSITNEEAWKIKAETIESNPSIVRIIRAEQDASVYYRENNPHLFYRVLSKHIMVKDYTVEEIYLDTVSMLKNADYAYEPDEKFLTDFKVYINTVYPKADLRGRRFIEDVIRRVVTKKREKIVTDRKLTEDCVPDYRKENDANVNVDVEREIVTEPDEVYPEAVVYNLAQDCSTADILCQQESKTEKNVLIVSLSTFPKSKTMDYSQYLVRGNDEISVEGAYQLDSVMNLLYQDGTKFDCVVILSTKETRDISDIIVRKNAESTRIRCSVLEYFLHHHRRLTEREYDDHSEIVLVDVTPENEIAPISKTVAFLRAMSQNGKINLYIDGHGGFRTTQVFLQAVMTLLQREDIELQKVYGVSFGENPNYIYEDKSYNMFSFVSGINEAIYHGRMDAIEEFYKGKTRPEMIDYMGKIAEGIQGGNLTTLEDGINKLRKYYRENTNGDDEYFELFKNQIITNYGNLITAKKSDVRDRIRWCMRIGLYQQALTFIESKVPEFLYEIGKIKTRSDYQEQLSLIEDKSKTNSIKNIIDACWYDTQFCSELVWKSGNNFNNLFARTNKTKEENEKLYIEFKKIVKGYLQKKEITKEQLMQSLTEIMDKNRKNVAQVLEYQFGISDLDACTFILLHRVLKDCRNSVNHLNEKKGKNYKLEAVKNAIEFYLYLLDNLLDKSKSKPLSKSINTKQNEKQIATKRTEITIKDIPVVVVEEQIYDLKCDSVRQASTQCTVKGEIVGKLAADGKPQRGYFGVPGRNLEIVRAKYLDKLVKVKLISEGQGNWSCELLEED